MRNRNDDPATLAEVVRRLMTIRDRLGAPAFRRACAKSLVAIGAAALAEAEKSTRKTGRSNSNVVVFRRRISNSEDAGSSENG